MSVEGERSQEHQNSPTHPLPARGDGTDTQPHGVWLIEWAPMRVLTEGVDPTKCLYLQLLGGPVGGVGAIWLPQPKHLVLSPRPSRCSPTGDRILVHLPPCANGPLGGHLLPWLFRAHPPGKVLQQPGTFQLPGESLPPGPTPKSRQPQDQSCRCKRGAGGAGDSGMGSPGCQAAPQAQFLMVQVRKLWPPEDSGHVQGQKQNESQ